MPTADAFTDDRLAGMLHPAGAELPWLRDGLRCVRAEVVVVNGDVATCRTAEGEDALMAVTEFPPHRRWSVGTEVVALRYLQGAQPWLSVNRAELVALVAEGVVPELRTGEVRVMGVSRSPGVRTKLAVAATVDGVDPVGTVVGKGANRVRAIARHLGGERLDVVAWHEDPASYRRNAFAPASVSAVEVDARDMVVTVPRHQMAAAVGEQGLNASLAGQLVGVTVTVVPG